MKKFLIAVLFAITSITIQAQSMVTEISWNQFNVIYTGLLVLYPDNSGIFRLHYYLPNLGVVWVQQDATLTNQYDYYGNCTSFINCYNPVSVPHTPYAADNFIVYPNGSMYAQDAAGNWSTLITAQIIPQVYWRSKFIEYGLQ